MGLFDFLKKKELEEIKHLKNQLEDKRKLELQLEKYKSITDIEEESERIKQLLNTKIDNKNNEINVINKDYNILKSDYKSALKTFAKLRKELSLYENKLDLVEFGMYEPIYDFEKSDEYRNKQKKVIDQQKQMIYNNAAAKCLVNWSVDGSEAKGKASTKKFIKLMLRAFNGECDALIAKVKWNNVNQIQERIKKSFEAINKLGESQKTFIEYSYRNLKIKELILEHEYQLKRQQEKEELRAIQEELREEEKAKREFEQAQKQAEKDELNYQKALDKARKEIESTTGKKHDELLDKISLLEKELQEAHERKERALSMAQQTKRGHVYIISNIGSFGENVYKIGMTRRLEPTDRVRELGDASVPFKFDIHSMIFSDEAPALENELHKAFSNKKVNMINGRREFFNVSIEEIENKVRELGFNADFIKIPEAMEYRESVAILEKINNKEYTKTIEEEILDEFPLEL